MTKNQDPESDLPTELPKPARRALVEAGYTRLEQFTTVSEDEVLKLHGMGPKALEQLHRALAARGLSFAHASGEDDEHAIRELVETWFTASKAGDLPTVLSLMTDDVVFMVPGQEPFGKEAFEATSEETKNVQIEGTSDIQEIRVLGDWAYLRNYIEMTMTLPDGGTPVRRSGYTLTILRKVSDGRWRLARDANLLTVEE